MFQSRDIEPMIKKIDPSPAFQLGRPSWLDLGALINVDAPGCGTSVVQGPKGHK